MKKYFELLPGLCVVSLTLFLAGCGDFHELPPPPPIENEEEIITDVILTFTPDGGSVPVTATAQDPDGEGPQDLEITRDIMLSPNTAYTLTIDLQNSIAGESITEEVEAEADEHLFFFEWTVGIFGDPPGNGNVDNRNDPVNYDDQDEYGLPLGLSTSWETGSAAMGVFTVILKHQPDDIKTAASTANDGETDVNLTWDITVQ
jgi:hypothetical protein